MHARGQRKGSDRRAADARRRQRVGELTARPAASGGAADPACGHVRAHPTARKVDGEGGDAAGRAEAREHGKRALAAWNEEGKGGGTASPRRVLAHVDQRCALA